VRVNIWKSDFTAFENLGWRLVGALMMGWVVVIRMANNFIVVEGDEETIKYLYQQ